MPWRNKDLFAEAASATASARTTNAPRAQRLAAAKEVWRAFNAWLDSRFLRRKGVCVPNFARISWETFTTTDSTGPRLRPVFLPAEGFCRACRLQPRRNLKPLELAQCQDINYSRIAIKFSRKLTKDEAFTGLREQLQLLARAVAAGKNVEISFNVGTLTCKEGKLRFEFDAEYLLRARSEPGTSRPSEVAPAQAADERTEEDPPTHERSLWSKQQARRSSTAPAVPVPSLSLATLQDSGLGDTADTLDERVAAALSSAARSGPEDGSSVASSEFSVPAEDAEDEAEAIKKRSLEGDHPVVVAAYERYFKEMEDNVRQEEADLSLLRTRTYAIEQARREQEKEARERQLELQAEIKAQIDFHERQRREERRQLLAQASVVDYPPLDPVGNVSKVFGGGKFGGALSPRAAAQRAKDELMKNYSREREAKKALLANLQRQMHEKKEREDAARRFQLEEERRYLAHLSDETERIESVKRAQREAKQRKLMLAWERDHKYRAILAERQRALHVRQGKPLTDEEAARNSSADHSVGFDVRRASSGAGGGRGSMPVF